MLLLYNVVIRLYYLAVLLASGFNKKAKQWIAGRKERALIRFEESIWFHFASLGEFEQGRPVLERMRDLHPASKIVITFFSPSGYEIRKNTPLADAVYYLPLDTAKNAAGFLDTIQPKLAIFTKYEYWYHFFNEARKRRIPIYVVSAIFRPEQAFFKWYGRFPRKILGFVNWFFLQDERSKQLLAGIGLENATVGGDTRFDRVWANAQQPRSISGLEAFKNGQRTFVAGSTWPEDEQLIAKLVARHPDLKFIIAPHEISEEKINKLAHLLPAAQTIKYSEISNLIPIVVGTHPDSYRDSNLNVLIIDNIGMLSSLYQYGEIAYIGGGFGAGIHNTLEAAAFGLPVIFGPNYRKFIEANDLIALKAGFSITDGPDLEAITVTLLNDSAFYATSSKKAGDYVKEHIGATGTIVEQITNNER